MLFLQVLAAILVAAFLAPIVFEAGSWAALVLSATLAVLMESDGNP